MGRGRDTVIMEKDSSYMSMEKDGGGKGGGGGVVYEFKCS